MLALSIDIGDTLPLDWYHNVSGVSRSTVASVHWRPASVDCEGLTRIVSPVTNCWLCAVEGACASSNSGKSMYRTYTGHLLSTVWTTASDMGVLRDQTVVNKNMGGPRQRHG